MAKLVCIVGAGEVESGELRIPEGAFVIAADGGLNHLESAGIKPDLIIGDFDSLGRVPKGENVLPHASEKSDTDTMLAIRKALSLGAETIIIFGGLGGRFDHSIANLQTLLYIANRGGEGFLIGCGCVCTVIKNGGIAFSENMSGTISVFSLSETATCVDLAGLKYPLSNHTLRSEFPLGVSNEFTGTAASVSVKNGALVVIWSGNRYCPEDYHRI